MSDQLDNLEQLLKSSKTASQPVEIDVRFKESLKEAVYKEYLDSITQKSLLDRIKSIFNFKFAISSLSIVAVISFIFFSGWLKTEESHINITKPTYSATFIKFDGEGAVEILRKDTDNWEKLALNNKVNEGDQIKTTENAFALFQIDNGSKVSLNKSSSLEFTTLDKEKVEVTQIAGESYHNVSNNNKHVSIAANVNVESLSTQYSINVTKEKITVKSYKENLVIKTDEGTQSVKEFEKVEIRLADDNLELKTLVEKDYKREFVTWNNNIEKEDGMKYDEVSPVITVSSPNNNTKTQSSAITISGNVKDKDSKLRKLIVNGKIYTTKPEKGFNLKSGNFDVNVQLKKGNNKIVIEAYDYYWNKATKTINVIREVVLTATPKPSNSFYISELSSPSIKTVSISWYIFGYSAPDGYKVVYSKTNTSPTYGAGDTQYQYVSDENTTSLTFSGLMPGQTYYFRVCIYEGGTCNTYTPTRSVVVKN